MSSAEKVNLDWNALVLDVCNVVTKLTGNVLEEKQRPMVESRLKRRCLDLKLEHPGDYKAYWMSNQEAENKVLIGLLTTHFTSFFREFTHFEWLANELPSIVATAKKEGRKSIRVWSAASSKGQEVWSLCMWLHQHMSKIDPSMDWTVYGSDIDPASVKEGENGVYHKRELETAPRHLWEHLWLRGKGEIADWYKIKPELRTRAKFRTMNLLGFDLPADDKYDVILCRNVLIYFDSNNLKKIITSLLRHLTPGGTLITGLSESLNGYGLPVKGLAPSIYRPQGAQVIELPKSTPKTLSMPSPLKVLCVDDSSTIITIMKKILVAPHFEIIGVAYNGLEAIEKLKTLKPDVITLDLHMPEMDGMTFLSQSRIASTIPVVVVSSVGREHDPLVGPLHSLGVMDFVEKPSLSNMAHVSEELTQKLKMAWVTKSKSGASKTTMAPASTSSTYSSSYKKRPNGKIVFNFGSADETKLSRVLREQSWENDHVIFCYNGKESIPISMKETLMKATVRASKTEFTTPFSFRGDNSSVTSIWLCFAAGDFSNLRLNKSRNGFLILEEGTGGNLQELANDMAPTTSFSYFVDKFLGGE
jgi:chemotaxis protein methyltransferase CheR